MYELVIILLNNTLLSEYLAIAVSFNIQYSVIKKVVFTLSTKMLRIKVSYLSMGLQLTYCDLDCWVYRSNSLCSELFKQKQDTKKVNCLKTCSEMFAQKA